MKQDAKVADLTFSGVTVHSSKRAFVTALMDELSEEGTDHSLVLRWAEGKWSQIPLADAVIGSCVVAEPGPVLVNVCATGQVKLLLSSGTAYETVDPSEDGPNQLATLRAARTIEGKVYAAGMARRVYCRVLRDRWQAIDRGVFLPRKERREGIGFLCIDGFSHKDILAAGYKGEIWHYDGEEWTKQDSPTNVALTTIRCVDKGAYYLAGMAGALLRGRVGAFEAIAQDVTTDDFWGAAIFKGVPYFATSKAVYRLIGDSLERVSFGQLKAISTGHLDCDEGVMWSVGAKDIAATHDGVKWEAIPGPS